MSDWWMGWAAGLMGGIGIGVSMFIVLMEIKKRTDIRVRQEQEKVLWDLVRALKDTGNEHGGHQSSQGNTDKEIVHQHGGQNSGGGVG